MRKLIAIAVITVMSTSVWGQTGTYKKIKVLCESNNGFADPINNYDPVYIYRADEVQDRAKLRIQMGDENTSDFQVGYEGYSANSWTTNFNVSGKGVGYLRAMLGVGTSNPYATLHVKSNNVALSSTNQHDANMIIEGTSNSRTTSNGAALGFIVPANSNGSNPWQQGRILVTPDNTTNANACGRMYLQTRYLAGSTWKWRDNLVLRSNGRVGIGTNAPTAKLDVRGTIAASEIKVELIAANSTNISGTLTADKITVNANGNTADFVFADDYNLRELSEVENFITTNKHLPDVPSASTMEEEGVNLAEMNKLLLQKVEELMLYTIEQEKRISQLEKLTNK